MTGYGLLGEPLDTVVAGTGAIMFIWLVYLIVTTNPPRKDQKR